MNPLKFSWANTLIDPTSVDIRFMSHGTRLDVLDTTYPHDKPQMLYWNVRSDFDGEAVVEISYFTSGITWSADYTCVSDRAETGISFEGFVKITNGSGEDYAGWIPEAAHFLLSIALHPLDLMISPPWTRMESDGRQTKPVDRSEHGTG